MKVQSTARRMMTAAAISSALLSAAAAPAQDRSAFPLTASSVSEKKSASAETKVCKKEAQPGSRLLKKICRTPEEWALEQHARAEKLIDIHQRN